MGDDINIKSGRDAIVAKDQAKVDISKYNIDAKNAQIGIIGDHGTVNVYPRNPQGIPLQRPEPVENFTDREVELEKLLSDLRPGHVVTLCGPGGIGKTAITAKAAWALAPGKELPKQFPDGMIFYSFYGKPDVDLAFDHIVRSYDDSPEDTTYAAASRLLSNKQALLIWDGAEEADDLRKVLKLRNNCGVIVTSRKREDAVNKPETIESLPTEEAVKLLEASAGDPGIDDATAKQICELVGGLPLAVRLAGRYLMEHIESPEEYLDFLTATPLKMLDQGDRKDKSVRLLMKRSLA